MAVALAVPAGFDPDRGLGRAAIYSGALHLALLVAAVVGLPQLLKPLPTEDRPLIIEALPLSSITNAPPPSAAPPTPQVQQAQRPQPSPPPRPQPQVTPPPAPSPPPQAQTPPPQPATPPPLTPPTPPQQTPAMAIPPPPAPPQPAPPQPAVAEPLPAPTPAPPPPPAPTVAAAPPQATTTPPPPPQPQPQPQTRTPPTPPQRQQPAFSLDNVLNDVRKQRPQPQQQAAAPAATAVTRPSNAPHNPLQPLSMTEEDAIRQRIVGNWNVDVGAKGIETFVVTLKVFVTADGTVQRADILETQGSPADALRAFADGARRATLRSSPLPVPAARAQQLTNGNLELRFSAREMLGMR